MKWNILSRKRENFSVSSLEEFFEVMANQFAHEIDQVVMRALLEGFEDQEKVMAEYRRLRDEVEYN